MRAILRARGGFCRVFCVSLLRGDEDKAAAKGSNDSWEGDFCSKACAPRQGLRVIGVSRGLLGSSGWKACAEDRKNLKAARLRGQWGDSL